MREQYQNQEQTSSTPAAYTGTTHAELMRAIGSKEGFDPMPPSQAEFLMDRSEPLTTRAIGWLFMATMHGGKRRKRYPCAVDDRGREDHDAVKRAARDLGVTPSNMMRAFRQLEEQNRCRVMDDGRIFFRGDANPPEMSRGEEEANMDESRFSTESIPADMLLFLKKLPPDIAHSATREYLEEGERWKKRKADAMALLRAQEHEAKIARMKRYGYAPEETRGRKRSERPNVTVSIRFLDLDDSEQNKKEAQRTESKTDFVHTENESVQNHILIDEVQEPYTVSTEPADDETPAQTPPPALLTPENPSQEGRAAEADPVIAMVEHHFGKLGAKNPLRAKFAALPQQFQIPARSVCAAIVDKIEEKHRKGYTIQTAGALYDFVYSGLPAYIKSHARQIEIARRYEAEEARDREASEAHDEEPFDPVEFARQFRAMVNGKGLR